MVEIVKCFFFKDTATTEIYTLSLHDALPIFVFQDPDDQLFLPTVGRDVAFGPANLGLRGDALAARVDAALAADRKSTRLNSSHANISYAVFCLKKNTSTFRS